MCAINNTNNTIGEDGEGDNWKKCLRKGSSLWNHGVREKLLQNTTNTHLRFVVRYCVLVSKINKFG